MTLHKANQSAEVMKIKQFCEQFFGTNILNYYQIFEI